MKKILVIGGSGMLGHKLVQILGGSFDVYTTLRRKYASFAGLGIFEKTKTFERVDVEEIASVERVLKEVRPDFVINAAGVIKQVADGGEVIKTLTVNSIFPNRLADLSETYDFRLVCISTDCVFSGSKSLYVEDDIPDAHDLYGRSKSLGEVIGENCLTLRTSIIGKEIGISHSLLEWFLSNRGQRVKGYANAIFSGFPTIIFANILKNLLLDHPDLSGLFHVSSNPINKFDLLNLINDRYETGITIDRFDEFQIDRSLDSSKFRLATGFQPVPWADMIDQMALDPTPYDEWRRLFC